MNQYHVKIVVNHSPNGRKAGQPADEITVPMSAPSSDIAENLVILEFVGQVMARPFAVQYIVDHDFPQATATLATETLQAPAFLTIEESADEPRWTRAN